MGDNGGVLVVGEWQPDDDVSYVGWCTDGDGNNGLETGYTWSENRKSKSNKSQNIEK